MALATKSKKMPERSRRVKDMTLDELRALIEMLIDRRLEENMTPRRPITATMRRRAIAAAGRFRSGCSNISNQHDEYLVASYSK
jgi:hypothetical protein